MEGTVTIPVDDYNDLQKTKRDHEEHKIIIVDRRYILNSTNPVSYDSVEEGGEYSIEECISRYREAQERFGVELKKYRQDLFETREELARYKSKYPKLIDEVKLPSLSVRVKFLFTGRIK
jgi:hypothetical protein